MTSSLRPFASIDRLYALPVDGAGSPAACYPYAAQKDGERMNICFFAVGGLAPLASIAPLASHLFNLELSGMRHPYSGIAAAMMPQEVDFYVYAPPQAAGGEKFLKPVLEWEEPVQAYRLRAVENAGEIPFALRLAARRPARDFAGPRGPGL